MCCQITVQFYKENFNKVNKIFQNLVVNYQLCDKKKKVLP